MFKLCESQEINDKFVLNSRRERFFCAEFELQLWSREIKLLWLQLLLQNVFRHIYLGMGRVFVQSTFASQTACEIEFS